MKQRCNNPNADKDKRYCYRGIKVCDEWQNSFESFEKWSFDNGYRPNEGLSIDRINVDKGYSPDNCRWTSIFVQSINKNVPAHKIKNNAKYYTINGETKNRKEWCKEFNISDAVVRYREKFNGMSFEEALKLEKRTKGNHLAYLNLPYAKSNDINRLNKCSSYIEANLYMAFIRLNSEFEILPNEHIGDYVVDFLEKTTKTIIECDGYDYHKSKEQVDSDCRRARKLLSMGYKVIRFSGVEINNDSDKCANELLEILTQSQEQYYES